MVHDSRASSPNGGFGPHERQERAGMRTRHGRVAVAVKIAQVVGACCSAGRASQTKRAAIAVPIVGEQSMRIRFASRSF
jgi:hypothetical protein